MKTKLLYCLGLCLLTLSIKAEAQQPVKEWIRTYDSSGPTGDKPANAKNIVTDNEGNSYVIGTANNNNTYESKAVTFKLSPTGEELWVQEYAKGSFSDATGIAVDNKGGVYVATGDAIVRYDAQTGAESWDNATDIRATDIAVDNQGSVYITGNTSISTESPNYATIRYDAATGNEIWSSTYNGESDNTDFATAIAVDNQGGVYVTGVSYTGDFGADYATVRYDAATGREDWVSRYSMGGVFGEPFIAVDNQGSVFITGTTYNSMTGYDIATVRYSATTGEQLWDRQHNKAGNGYDWATAIAVDSQGSVYVTGYSGSTYNNSDFTTIRYDVATGEQKWLRYYNEADNTRDQPAGIAVDNQGDVYVTGTSQTGESPYALTTIHYEADTGNLKWVSTYRGKEEGWAEAEGIAVDNKGGVLVTGFNAARETGPDIVVIRYEATTGEKDWEQRFNSFGSQSDYGIAVAVDAAGNAYVTGISDNHNFNVGQANIVTIKYSPTGEELWVSVYDGGLNNQVRAIAVDNEGGVFVTGSSDGDYVTIRYDAATGNTDWEKRYNGDYNGWDNAAGLALDGKGGIYVTGSSQTGENTSTFVTIRYDAATGQQEWATSLKGESNDNNAAEAIAVDSTGGVYVTGNSAGDYLTVRYDAATGTQAWASTYSGEGAGYERPTAIAVDNQGSVYVTGSSEGIHTFADYATVSYDAATGQQQWVSRYDAGKDGFDHATAIAVDNRGGVYVTGGSQSMGGEEMDHTYDVVTIRYEASSGAQKWLARYDGNDLDFANAIAVDNAGGVYVTGRSETSSGGAFNTLKYNAADGTQVWAIQTEEGETDNAARDLALDAEGNVFVTGYGFRTGTGTDIITVKYSQGQCAVLADAAIQGNTTAATNTKNAVYTLTGSNATSYTWRITGTSGSDYTGFTGQGTSSISVDWPATPDVYRLSVSYSAGEGCPTRDTTFYVHVFNPQAGFVTGSGWLTSPANPDFELMQGGGRIQWGLVAKYKPKTEDVAQGSLMLLLESGPAIFRSTSVEDGSLVITGNNAFFRGQGTLSYLNGSGGMTTDPRRFAYLVSATDGNYNTKHTQRNKEEDRLRILIWELNADGTRGAVVYNNQAACSTNLAENAPACAAIGGGNITIHGPSMKNSRENAVLALEEGPAAQGLMAYPTAFSKRTTLGFTTEQDTDYSLELYDLKGALVRRIATGTAQAGQRYEHEVLAEGLSKGLYVARLAAGEKVETVKIVLER